MTDPTHTHQHPFALESIYRETAATTTDGNLNDPEKVLKPLIDLYLHQREAMLQSLDQQTKDQLEARLTTEKSEAWWKLMPYFLPPKRSNHEFALIYGLYRLTTTDRQVTI